MIAALGPRVTGLSLRVARFVAGWISVASAWLFRALRPLLMWFFRGLAAGESGLRALGRGATKAAIVAATVLTPRRAIGLVLAASGALLVVSQFIDYHGVQIGEQVDLPGGIKSAPPRPSTCRPPATRTPTRWCRWARSRWRSDWSLYGEAGVRRGGRRSAGSWPAPSHSR